MDFSQLGGIKIAHSIQSGIQIGWHVSTGQRCRACALILNGNVEHQSCRPQMHGKPGTRFAWKLLWNDLVNIPAKGRTRNLESQSLTSQAQHLKNHQGLFLGGSYISSKHGRHHIFWALWLIWPATTWATMALQTPAHGEEIWPLKYDDWSVYFTLGGWVILSLSPTTEAAKGMNKASTSSLSIVQTSSIVSGNQVNPLARSGVYWSQQLTKSSGVLQLVEIQKLLLHPSESSQFSSPEACSSSSFKTGASFNCQ